MGDIETFYAELNNASSTLSTATSNLSTEAANIYGEDTGIENPAPRSGLRLEIHRRMSALRDTVYSFVSKRPPAYPRLSRIADRYADLDLDLELTERSSDDALFAKSWLSAGADRG